MPNMSYCRFQNTLLAFADCRSAVDEMVEDPMHCRPLSREELRAAKALAQEAIDFLQLLSDYAALDIEVVCSDHEDTASTILDNINQEVAEARAMAMAMDEENDEC